MRLTDAIMRLHELLTSHGNVRLGVRTPSGDAEVEAIEALAYDPPLLAEDVSLSDRIAYDTMAIDHVIARCREVGSGDPVILAKPQRWQPSPTLDEG